MSILTQRCKGAEVAEKVRLGDVCSIVLGGTPSTRVAEYWGGDVPWLTPGDMGKLDGVYVSETSRKLTQEGLLAGSTLFPSSSVIVSTRAPIGYVFVNSVPMCTNQGCKTLIPNGNVNARFLCLYLRSRVNELNALGTGTTFKELSTKALKNFIIPLPPLPTQRRIAAELDKICELKKNAETRLEKLDLLVKSRFVEMFGDGIAEKSLPDICEIIDGDRGKNYPTQGDFSSDGYCLFLNAKNVTKNGFAFEETSFITKTKDESLRKGKLTRGDVVLTTRGTIGNIAYFDETVPYSNIRINSGMVILRMDNERLNQIYFAFAFKKKMQVLMRKLVSGSAQPQLPISVMRKIMLPVPPLALQREFAAFVVKVDKLRLNVRETVAKMDVLYRSKLQEYFG